MTKKDGLDEQVTLRVASSDVSRIDNLAEQLPLKRSAVIRAALRLGLAMLEEDPSQLFRARAIRPAPQSPVVPMQRPASVQQHPNANHPNGTWGRPTV